MLRSKAPESRFDSPIIGQWRDPKCFVKITGSLNPMKCLVERVKEIACHDQNKDATAMSGIARRGALGSRFTRANGNSIVNILNYGSRILYPTLSVMAITCCVEVDGNLETSKGKDNTHIW